MSRLGLYTFVFAGFIGSLASFGCGGRRNPGTFVGNDGGDAGDRADVPVNAVCGNGVREEGEACEQGMLGAETCEGLGFVGGTLGCTATCVYDTAACETCGDGDIDAARGEVCDGTELGAATCISLGGTGGVLSCNPDCTFNQTACTDCGDGTADDDEECDRTDVRGQTCVSLGLEGGAPGCTADCRLDRTTCTGPDLIVYADGLQINLDIREGENPSACEVSTGCAGGSTNRRVLDFTLVSENIGNQTLHFGSPTDVLPPYNGLWERTCFAGGRYEFPDYATYWICPSRETNCAEEGSERVANGRKGSFCFIENFGRAPDWTGPPATCGRFNCGDMGQQPGCADNYFVGLDCQYVDITGLANGSYTLCAHLDPLNRIYELRDDNNIGCTSITIPISP